MKKVLFILLMAGVAALLPFYAQAQEEAQVEEQEVVFPELSGKVVAIDTAASTIVIELAAAEEGAQAEQKTVQINDATVIQKAGAAAKLSDVAVGDQVTVAFVIDEAGVVVAKAVGVQ